MKRKNRAIIHLIKFLNILESFKLVTIILTAVGFENNFSSSIILFETRYRRTPFQITFSTSNYFIYLFLLLRLENKPVFVNSLRTSERLLLLRASVGFISSGSSCSIAAGEHSHPILLQLNYEILNITHEPNM